MSIEQSVVFPEHFGFCGGVAASDMLMTAVAAEAQRLQVPNVYGYHDIVHDQAVVRRHTDAGVIFVKNVDDVPDGSIVVSSAHGVSPEIKYEFGDKDCLFIDAVCPLVTHTHIAAERARREGEKLLYLHGGKMDHDEIVGMVGHMDFADREDRLEWLPVEREFIKIDDPDNLVEASVRAVLERLKEQEHRKFRIASQTTLHADRAFHYRDRLKGLIAEALPDATVKHSHNGDVCPAVKERQAGVDELIQIQPKRIVVVTDAKSKNGMGYYDQAVAVSEGTDTSVHAVNSTEEAESLGIIDGVTAVTASASAPDSLIFDVARRLGATSNPEVVRDVFNLPRTFGWEQKLAEHVQNHS